MYTLELETVFSAAHAIRITGTIEPLHGHDWRVTAVIEGDRLDDDGLLVDFHAIKGELETIVSRWHNRNLNETPPFDRINPTAEHVCKQIADELQRRIAIQAKTATSDNPRPGSGRQSPADESEINPRRPGVRVVSVRVTEAVGCAATYYPSRA